MIKLLYSTICCLILTVSLSGQIAEQINSAKEKIIEARANFLKIKDVAQFAINYKDAVGSGYNVQPGMDGQFEPSAMLDDYILMTEDGIIMKDLVFHNFESCQARIITALGKVSTTKGQTPWLYVNMTGSADYNKFINVLTFLREENIDYRITLRDEDMLTVYSQPTSGY